MLNHFCSMPDCATVFTTTEKIKFSPVSEMNRGNGVALQFTNNNGLNIRLTADGAASRFLGIRWRMTMAENSLFLADAWERTYGDTGWRNFDASRLMPWYFLQKTTDSVRCFGVKVRPAAFAAWTADPHGVTLWLDLRSGTRGVELNGRTLDVATVLFCESADDAWSVAGEFCRAMCADPLLTPSPVYGGNNWYYAYGHSSRREILEDCRYLGRLTEGLPNRPFMVIDGGRDPSHGKCGPWDSGNEKFPDMPSLAGEMKQLGVKPGIWFRPLCCHDASIPKAWRSMREPAEFLDPSVPEVLERVAADVARFAEWGFELVKHDFTTFDCFGKWGFEMNDFPAAGDWSFRDTTRTSAEILLELYRRIRQAAGEMLILGCNTVGHFGAGLMHLSRIGDDTSGQRWERTRKMGVNTLAFRLPQHGAFFAVDADCLGVTGDIPRELNRQWAQLLATSGTPLFASLKPGVLGEAENREMREFFRLASVQKSRAVPLDWLSNVCPENWELNGKTVRFNWYEPECFDADFLK